MAPKILKRFYSISFLIPIPVSFTEIERQLKGLRIDILISMEPPSMENLIELRIILMSI
jgi:hypothetical protein